MCDEQQPESSPPYVHPDGVVWWVAEYTAIPVEIVRQVVELKDEYLIAVGIMYPEDPPEGVTIYQLWPFRCYDPAEPPPLLFHDGMQTIDVERICRDAERLLGIPASVAERVLNGEMEYLHMRGIAG
jgi:hypothetical protein